jgi:hypothetical protein
MNDDRLDDVEVPERFWDYVGTSRGNDTNFDGECRRKRVTALKVKLRVALECTESRIKRAFVFKELSKAFSRKL